MAISRAEALDALRSDDLIGLGMEADAVRRRLHPEGVVSYAVTGELTCTTDLPGLCRQARSIVERGASGVQLSGLMASGLENAADAIRALRTALPEIWLAGAPAAELGSTGTELSAALEQLRDAGLDSLVPSPLDPATPGAWLAAHRAAHRLGMRTVAALRFGAAETLEQRIDALEALRELQAETKGFAAFVPEPAGSGLHGPTAVECLKMLAVSRLLLEQVSSIEFAPPAGLKVLEVGLRFGADDAGVVPIKAGARADLREEDLRRVIRDAGFQPVERDLGYRMQFVA